MNRSPSRFPVGRSVPDMLADRTAYEPNTGCWLWIGNVNVHGYGVLNVDGKRQRAHRVAYQLEVGPVPEGKVLDHLCRVRCCVNPSHLEPVTARENSIRGDSPNIRAFRAGTCKRGHPRTAENTYFHVKGGRRHCLACAALTDSAYRARKGAKGLQP